MLRKTKRKIVLAPFPFDDLSSDKIRPALRLTRIIGTHRQTVLAYITSKVPPSPLTSDLILDSSHPDFALTGLKITSTLRIHLLYTIANDHILRELGELPPAFDAEVDERLRSLFELAS
ncbi:type II toxin-antitoxin system PemK/MazF family toxin [bacterium]|nr:MAG: type II toxin-antitoxin system PemK/MazF family toxin [bacterium]